MFVHDGGITHAPSLEALSRDPSFRDYLGELVVKDTAPAAC